jgi:hypothetical protein
MFLYSVSNLCRASQESAWRELQQMNATVKPFPMSERSKTLK